MEAKLKINGVDFIPWVKEGGIQQTDIKRQSRSVVTLDGTLYQTEVIKRGISVNLVEMRDATLFRLTDALTNPAVAEYTDKNGGTLEKTFYISGPHVTEKTIMGGNTYLNGISFSMEER